MIEYSCFGPVEDGLSKEHQQITEYAQQKTILRKILYQLILISKVNYHYAARDLDLVVGVVVAVDGAAVDGAAVALGPGPAATVSMLQDPRFVSYGLSSPVWGVTILINSRESLSNSSHSSGSKHARQLAHK